MLPMDSHEECLSKNNNSNNKLAFQLSQYPTA